MSKMNYLNLGDKNFSILTEFLNEIGAENEFEIRFGKYIFNPTTKKSNFESNVEIDFFYRLKNYMTQQQYVTSNINTNEFIFDLNGDKIRKIINLDESVHLTKNISYISKNTKRIYNIYDFDIRLSLASEKLVKMSDLNNSDATFVRIKRRETFDLGFANLDFTIVKEGKNMSEATMSQDKFEVEFEIKEKNLNKLINTLTIIMQVRQNNKFIISNIEKRDVFYKYKNLTGTPYFIGAQPETLQKDQLSLLYKELFSVTDKADGDRYFMMINDTGAIYYIDNNIQGMLKTNLYSSEYKNTLIDGELIISAKGVSFYAFDIMFVDGKDLRGNQKYLFKERFNILKDVVDTIKSSSTDNFYTVEVKKFIYRNVFLGSEIIMDNIDKKPYTNDGLIFTPMNEPYPTTKKWNKLLKWKPADQNTIDFFSIQNEDGSWNLYVQGPQESQSKSNFEGQKMRTTSNLVLFDVNKLCGPEENNLKTVPITFKTTFDNKLLDPTTNEPYKTNTVIEYKWNTESNKFIPIRTRWDKTANPKKHGNYYQVACSIWNNINNPITSETLFQMTNGSTPQNESKNGFFFERMNFFNNKVKEYLNNKYSSSEYLLTSKLFESEEIFKEYLDNLNSEYVITIISNIDDKFDDTNYIENNQIMYCIKNLVKDDSRIFGKTFKIFVNDGHKKGFDVNGESLLEYKVDYYTLIDSMKEHGYECIEADLFMNLYKNFEMMNKSKENKLLNYEKDLVFTYRYCVFRKNNDVNEQKFPKLKNQKIHEYKIDLTNDSTPELFGLQFYKIGNIYNVIDLINCIEYKVYKNMFENKSIDSIKDWDKINIGDCNLILHNYENAIETNGRSNIYIYKYEYLTEKENDEVLDISHSDYYAVLYQNKIILDEDEIKKVEKIILNYEGITCQEEIKNNNNDRTLIDNYKNDIDNYEEKTPEYDSIKKQLESSEKLTIPVIKDFLKRLALKTSGNKEELLLRLKSFLNKNE